MGQPYGAGVLMLDTNLKVTFATPSIKRIIGYDSALTISKGIIELVADRDKGAFKDAIALSANGVSIGTVGLVTDRGITSPVKFAISRRSSGYMMLFYDASAEKLRREHGHRLQRVPRRRIRHCDPGGRFGLHKICKPCN